MTRYERGETLVLFFPYHNAIIFGLPGMYENKSVKV